MNKEIFLGMFFGVITGVFVAMVNGALLAKIKPSEDVQKAIDLRQQGVELVAECEKELPRNLHCELVMSANIKAVMYEN